LRRRGPDAPADAARVARVQDTIAQRVVGLHGPAEQRRIEARHLLGFFGDDLPLHYRVTHALPPGEKGAVPLFQVPSTEKGYGPFFRTSGNHSDRTQLDCDRIVTIRLR